MNKATRLKGDQLLFWCPGCETMHAAKVLGSGAVWAWNGSTEAPTLTPSVLIRTGHYVTGHHGGTCWCTYNAEHPNNPAPFTCSICHSFVRDGKIEFLTDCTHSLAGQTVDLEVGETAQNCTP